MTTTAALSLSRELAAIVGNEHVHDDAATRARFAVDEVEPEVVASPANAEEIAAVLRYASVNQLSVVPFGGGTQQATGAIPEHIDVALSTARLDRISDYDPGDLTFSAGAGVTLAQLDAAVGRHAQLLPLDVARPDVATIGGALAANSSGPLRHGYGTVRDYCIGIEFVTGDGKIAHGGGHVVKNVAGYDLMKLLIGSCGTLGVIVSANFKVVPRPRQTATFVAEFSTAAEALRLRDHVIASALTPFCLEIVSPQAREYLAEPQAPRNPDTWSPGGHIATERVWSLLVRAAGSDAVLARYVRELGGLTELRADAEAALWRYVVGFPETVLARHRNAMIVRVGVTITGVAAALDAIEHATLDYNFLPAIIGRCGQGALLVGFVPLAVDPPGAMNYAAAASALRAALPGDAQATVLRCPREAKPHFDLWGSTPTSSDMMRAIKHALDPHDTLNRGRFMA